MRYPLFIQHSKPFLACPNINPEFWSFKSDSRSTEELAYARACRGRCRCVSSWYRRWSSCSSDCGLNSSTDLGLKSSDHTRNQIGFRVESASRIVVTRLQG